MKHSKVETLEKIIQFVRPVRDIEKKRFVPYCMLGWHAGIVSPQYYQLCEARQCKHYQRLYLK